MRPFRYARVAWAALFVALGAEPSAVISAPAARPDWATYPVAASSLAPVELSSLIAKALPRPGAARLAWSHLLDEAIVWRTDGFRRNPLDRQQLERLGLARVRVRGKRFTVFRRRPRELAWSIRLVTREAAVGGPREIEISPGSPAGCAPAEDAKCDFDPRDAFRAPLAASEVCRRRGQRGRAVVYAVRAPGAADALVLYVRARTPEGDRARLVIQPFSTPAQSCRAAAALVQG